MEGVRARTAKLNGVMYVYVCNIQYMYVYMFYVYVCVCMNVCVHISTVYECMCLYETVFTCGIGATAGGQAGSPSVNSALLISGKLVIIRRTLIMTNY